MLTDDLRTFLTISRLRYSILTAKTVTEYPDAPDIESSTYDYASRFYGPVGEWLVNHQVNTTREILRRYFAEGERFSVLDVGGGHGQNINLINAMGGTITIVGSDLNCTEVIGEQVAAGKAEFRVASLLDLPFEDASFDVVICYRILSHMASWQKLIGELDRVSRNLVLVDYPSKRSFNIFSDLLFSVKKRIEKNTRRYGCYHDKQIDQEFGVHNRTRVYEKRQFFLPMALDRLIGRVAVSRILAGFFRAIGLTRLFGSPVIACFTRRSNNAYSTTN